MSGWYSPWRPYLQAEEVVNDSDKTLTVPAGTEWHIMWVWVELATSADVGDRQLVVEFQDAAGDVMGQVRAGVVQAASLTRYYLFAPSLADLLGFRDTDYLMTPLPPTVLLNEGMGIRVYDNNVVAVGADDMVVQMMILGRSVV